MIIEEISKDLFYLGVTHKRWNEIKEQGIIRKGTIITIYQNLASRYGSIMLEGYLHYNNVIPVYSQYYEKVVLYTLLFDINYEESISYRSRKSSLKLSTFHYFTHLKTQK